MVNSWLSKLNGQFGSDCYMFLESNVIQVCQEALMMCNV